MTNTSDKYERTQQGNLLSLVGLGAFDISVDFVAINNFVITNACSNSAPMLISYPAFYSF